MTTSRYVLLGKCDDAVGLVSTISEWIRHIEGNILDLEQFVNQESQRFFIRLEWSQEQQRKLEDIRNKFDKEIAQKLQMNFSIHSLESKQRMAIFVSKFDHCLWDLLARYHQPNKKVEIPLIISNHNECEHIAKKFGIDFIQVDFSENNKQDIEAKQQKILEQYKIDFIALARYMQILSNDFVDKWENKIINIHHSFLPAFPGAKPYHQAHKRGVKVIGASAHYVTSELDAGPIIEQEVTRVTHRDDVSRLLNKGQELEKVVLSRAVNLHINRYVIVEKNRTYILV